MPFDKDAQEPVQSSQPPTANSEGRADAKVCREAGVAPSRRPRLVV
jgi:hypothetical protein